MPCIDCGHFCQSGNCYTCTARGCPRMAGAPPIEHETAAALAYKQEWAKRRAERRNGWPDLYHEAEDCPSGGCRFDIGPPCRDCGNIHRPFCT